MSRNLGGAHDDSASRVRVLGFADGIDEVLGEIGSAEGWVPHGLLNLTLSVVHRHPTGAGDLQRALAGAVPGPARPSAAGPRSTDLADQ